MIEIIKGDILKQNTEALVNTVNCVGVMGRGIALAVKNAYPENYRLYKEACENKEVTIGRMYVYVAGDIFEKKYIINFPTKLHWKGKSKIEYIKSGLADLVRVINEYCISSIAIPPLGCGLGGLDWKVVRPVIENALKDLSNIEVKIIEPDKSFEIEPVKPDNGKKNKLTKGRAALIVLIGRYLEAMMDTSVTLLELHKLMYFLQESGEPLRLNYQKAQYGPYAINLRHVLDVMNGIYIKGFDDREDNPQKEIELLDDAYSKAEDFLAEHEELKQRLEKVSALISGFETPFGMELLSTVHWVVKNENADSQDKVISATYAWNNRKQMFNRNHIIAAWNKLKVENWIS